MQAERYFGTYARFETRSKKDAATLLGADNLVGDVFDIVFETEEGTRVAWMKNRFGSLVGHFDAETSRELSILAARGWNMRALLSFVAFTDSPEPGHYWGQVALICHENNLTSAIDPFVDRVAGRLMDGIRPDIDLGSQGIRHLVESQGTWQPKQTVPLPQSEPGTAIIKSRRKINEKLIEQGRKGNKGCYAASWILLLALITLLLFGLKACGWL